MLELLHVLTFENVTIMRNFEVICDKYNVMKINSRVDVHITVHEIV
jgi:hypothetical protein